MAALARRDQQVIVGEARWETASMGMAHLDALVGKVAQFPRLRGYTVLPALFSKSGFTRELMRTDRQVLLFEGPSLTRVR